LPIPNAFITPEQGKATHTHPLRLRLHSAVLRTDRLALDFAGVNTGGAAGGDDTAAGVLAAREVHVLDVEGVDVAGELLYSGGNQLALIDSR